MRKLNLLQLRLEKMRIFYLLVNFALSVCIVSSKQHKNIRINRRPIVGGIDTNIGNYPYQAALVLLCSRVTNDTGDESADSDGHKTEPITYFHCGASVISVSWVLSAAHCFKESVKPQELGVRVGSSIVNSGGTIHEVDKYILHSNYIGDPNYDCDIALIKVIKPFEIGPNVQPITLNKHPLRSGMIAIVTGWGHTTEYGNLPEILQKVEVPVLPHWECKILMGENFTDFMFCAGRAGRDACQGDSGGPIVVDGWQIGVVSWGEGCGLAGYGGVYTDVHKFREWIRKNSGV